jgi:hypothetical protein
MASDDESQQRGPQSHPSEARENTCNAGRAIDLLAPTRRYADLRALFQNRVSVETIRQWRSGRREMPQWAIDCLHDRIAPVLALTPGPGRGGKLIAWLKANGRYPAKEKAAG